MEKEKIYNTASKRYLQIGGKQYKKLIDQGYTVFHNELIPPQILKKSPTKVKSKKSIKITSNSPVKNNQFILPVELTDVVPNIIQNLDVKTIRSLNLNYNNQYTNKDIIYNFIITHFDKSEIDDFNDYFDDINDFNNKQRQFVDQLDNQTIHFLMYYMFLINKGAVEQMDKEGMTPYKTICFALYNNQIIILTNYTQTNGQLKYNSKQKEFDPYIYNFIKKHFDQYDYYRLVEYYYEENDIIPSSFNNLIKSQSDILKIIDDDMNQFLRIFIKFILTKKLIFANMHFISFDVSGFLFLNERLVVFNER